VYIELNKIILTK